MRPGQNKRMRGRNNNNNNNNNRRGPNPLTRSYESNGPDVKIRGNAHHVAEKYLQLARDAHTSSDPVAAENYLQHAEHYFRIIASAQQAQQQAQSGYQRAPGEPDADDFDEDDDIGGLSDRFASPAERANYQSHFNAVQPPAFPQQNQPQPPIPVQTYQERPFDGERPQSQGDRPYQNRPNNSRPDNRPDRGPRPDRPFQDRNDQRDNRPRDFRPQRELPQRDLPQRDLPQPREVPPQVEQPLAPGLPSFITAPARINPAPGSDEEANMAMTASVEPSAPLEAQSSEPRFPPRGRRRRGRPSFGFDAPPSEGEGESEAGEPAPDTTQTSTAGE